MLQRNRIGIALVLGMCVLWMGGATAEESEKVTYTEHVQPIFREHCFVCHNQNNATNDLALDSYQRVVQGGASGPSIEPGDPDASYLWLLVSHQQEPYMPAGQDKLPEAKLSVIRSWIAGGALENPDSKPTVNKPKVDLSMSADVAEGKAIMPEGLPQEPIVVVRRAGAATAIATAPWAPLVAVAGQRQIVLYHTETGERLGMLPFEAGVPYDLKFSQSGAVLVAGGGVGAWEGLVTLYDVKSGETLTTLGAEYDAVLAADIDPQQSHVVLGGPERLVRLYNVADGSMRQEIGKHTDWIYAAAISPDGILTATADRSGGLWVWEAGTDREFCQLDGHKDGVTALAWRADSNVLVSASEDGTVKLWNMIDGKQLRSINAHGEGVLDIDVAADGRIVSAGRDRRVKLWDPSGQQIRAFPEFSDIVLEVAITHDGTRIIAGDWQGEIRLIDAESGETVATLSGNPPAQSVAEPPADATAAQ